MTKFDFRAATNFALAGTIAFVSTAMLFAVAAAPSVSQLTYSVA